MNAIHKQECVDYMVERMKKEIRADVAKGAVPASVESFSGLHDFVDANMYSDPDGFLETHTWDELTDVFNDASDVVDAWIKEGGLK